LGLVKVPLRNLDPGRAYVEANMKSDGVALKLTVVSKSDREAWVGYRHPAADEDAWHGFCDA
jgi:hypothetical protein